METALDEGIKARTVVRCLMVLSQVFRYAKRPRSARGQSGQRPKRPAALGQVRPLQVQRAHAPAVRAIAEAMPSKHGRAAVLVSAWTGLRICELVELRWRDLAWNDQRLHVRRSFGRNGVRAPRAFTAARCRWCPTPSRSASATTRRSAMTSCSWTSAATA